MLFWDQSYSTQANIITNQIHQEFKISDYENMYLFVADKEIIIDAALVQAWMHFLFLFEERNEKLNELTPYCQEKYKEKAYPSLSSFKEDKPTFLFSILRILHEYYFWSPDRDEIPHVMAPGIAAKLADSVIKSSSASYFRWLEFYLPTALIRNIIDSDNFKTLLDISGKIESYSSEITKVKDRELSHIETELQNNKNEVESLLDQVEQAKEDLSNYENKLTEYKGDYNFILLSKAFKKMQESKSRELSIARYTTWFFTCLLTLPPIFSFSNHIKSWVAVGEGVSSLSFYLPLVTLEILIFYFMRLYYGEVRVLNTQLLQIDHRLSLCEFIHDYIEKKNTDKENKESWGMFESLIFSPIQATPDNIPSVLDGANAVAELAGKVMAKSKSS